MYFPLPHSLVINLPGPPFELHVSTLSIRTIVMVMGLSGNILWTVSGCFCFLCCVVLFVAKLNASLIVTKNKDVVLVCAQYLTKYLYSMHGYFARG